MTQTYVQYAERKIPVLVKSALCVVGGGPAGVAAALTAAKGGVKTLLVEKSITLGGLQTLGLVEPFMPTLTEGSDTPFVQEIKKRLAAAGIEHADGKTGTCWSNPEALAYIYDEMAKEVGLKVLYNSTLVDVLLKKETKKVIITTLILQTIQGLVAVEADAFVDATGDAVLARLAGVPVEAGYEKTGYNQPMSFRFEMGGIDLEKLHAYMQSIHDDWCQTDLPHFEIAEARHRTIKYKLEAFFMKGVRSGELQEEDAEYFQAFTIPGKPGCMSMNCPELPVRFKAVDALTYSEGVAYGRAMIRRISAYLIKHLPGFEHAYLSREASVLGARESFRIRGRYYMTEADYYARRLFTDAVARTAWYIDAHGEKVGEYLKPGEFYEIPYRAMITDQFANLVVAGRCISVSFILEASMRIQATCMSIGEAAGKAAIWAAKKRVYFNEIKWEDIPPAQRSYVSSKIV
jgi:ribulose 1,5-bisphosphate synthetase/thiazole synthase